MGWNVSECPMILGALVLAALGHIEVISPDMPAGNTIAYKARLLREVSRRMVSTETAASDSTITALMMLTSFEVSATVKPNLRRRG